MSTSNFTEARDKSEKMYLENEQLIKRLESYQEDLKSNLGVLRKFHHLWRNTHQFLQDENIWVCREIQDFTEELEIAEKIFKSEKAKASWGMQAAAKKNYGPKYF